VDIDPLYWYPYKNAPADNYQPWLGWTRMVGSHMIRSVAQGCPTNREFLKILQIEGHFGRRGPKTSCDSSRLSTVSSHHPRRRKGSSHAGLRGRKHRRPVRDWGYKPDPFWILTKDGLSLVSCLRRTDHRPIWLMSPHIVYTAGVIICTGLTCAENWQTDCVAKQRFDN